MLISEASNLEVLDRLRAASTANPDAFTISKAGIRPELVSDTTEYLDRVAAVQAGLAAAAARDTEHHPPRAPYMSYGPA